MISSCDEIRETKQILAEVSNSLEKEGVDFNRDIEIGIMVEVPSAVIMAASMAPEVDFFSIGTNDLIQYALAIDRGNEEVSYLYEPLHPAIIHMIEKNIGVFMCGEMAGDPINIPILLGLGMDELSMNPQSIPAVKRMIRTLNVGDAREFMKEVLKKTTSRDIINLVQDTYGAMLSNETPSEYQKDQT